MSKYPPNYCATVFERRGPKGSILAILQTNEDGSKGNVSVASDRLGSIADFYAGAAAQKALISLELYGTVNAPDIQKIGKF